MPTESDTDTFASGFVAGTPVWTDKGLVPIEQLKVGDLVLAQPEAKGELQYKRITKIFVHEDKLIWRLQHYDPRNEVLREIYATGNHPFWVKSVPWTALENLKSNQILELHDSSEAAVSSFVGRIYCTDNRNIGFILGDYDEQFGHRIDFNNNLRNVTTSVDGDCLSDFYQWNETTDEGVFFHSSVFNIEVEDSNTYYVGKSGLLTGGAGLVTHSKK